MKKRKASPQPSSVSDLRARIGEIEAEAKAAGMAIVIKQKPARKRKSASYPPGSFSEVFRLRLEKIESDAKAVGANLTIVCKIAKISRAGPTRWRNDIPMTIKVMDKMERAVKKLAEKFNKAKSEGSDSAD
jgi:hypothetical protein